MRQNLFSSFKALLAPSTVQSTALHATLSHCNDKKCFHNSDLTIVATSYVMRCSNKGSGLVVASAENKYALHISFDVETKLRECPLFQKVSFSLLLFFFFWLLCSAVTMTGHPQTIFKGKKQQTFYLLYTCSFYAPIIFENQQQTNNISVFIPVYRGLVGLSSDQ